MLTFPSVGLIEFATVSFLFAFQIIKYTSTEIFQ